MKKLLICSLLLLTLSLIYSCTTEVTIEPVDQNVEINLKTGETHLKTLGSILLPILSTQERKDHVYSKVAEMFTDEACVLIGNLINEQSNGISIASVLDNEATGKVNKALNYFRVDGDLYHPQIYIPFFNSNKLGRVTTTSPIYVFALEDVDIYDGYILDSNNKLQKLPFMIDEDYASKNEVWVISVNETYTGKIEDVEKYVTNNKSEVEPSQRIHEITIKCHKESWALGASEVHIKSIIHDFDYDNDLWTNGSNSDLKGNETKKVSWSDVENQVEHTVNDRIVTQWNTNYNTSIYDRCSFVQFEWDLISGTQYDHWSSYSLNFNFSFKSADTSYRTYSELFKGEGGTLEDGNCSKITTIYL